MASKVLKKLIHTEDDTLLPIGSDFFCVQPIQHILSGFYIDKTRHRIYFGQIYLPLCDRFSFLHLGFGYRLEGEFGTMKIGSKDRDVAHGFIKAIQPYRQLALKLADLESFVSYALHHVDLGNPIIRRGCANSMILLEKYVEAEGHLELTLSATDSHSRVGWVKEFSADTLTILKELRRDPSAARELLLFWEAETKQKFGIPL